MWNSKAQYPSLATANFSRKKPLKYSFRGSLSFITFATHNYSSSCIHVSLKHLLLFISNSNSYFLPVVVLHNYIKHITLKGCKTLIHWLSQYCFAMLALESLYNKHAPVPPWFLLQMIHNSYPSRYNTENTEDQNPFCLFLILLMLKITNGSRNHSTMPKKSTGRPKSPMSLCMNGLLRKSASTPTHLP